MDQGAAVPDSEPALTRQRRVSGLRVCWRGVRRFVRRYATPLSAFVSAIATVSLVWVASQQLAVSNEQHRRSVRAYLLFDSGSIEKRQGNGNQYTVILKVKNSGQTPAYWVRHSWNVRIYDYPLPGTGPSGIIEFDQVDGRRSADIGAATSVVLDDPRMLTITPTDKDEIAARRKAIYVWARLHFRDAFQTNQCTDLIAVNVPADGTDKWNLRNYQHMTTDYPGGCGQ